MNTEIVILNISSVLQLMNCIFTYKIGNTWLPLTEDLFCLILSYNSPTKGVKNTYQVMNKTEFYKNFLERFIFFNLKCCGGLWGLSAASRVNYVCSVYI